MSMTNAGAAEHNADHTIGDRVHQLMWRARVTQTALAPLLGIGQTALSMKLRGKRGWSADDIVTLARYFKVSTDYLFGFEDDVVGPAGIEPTTSTVEYGRSAEILQFPLERVS